VICLEVKGMVQGNFVSEKDKKGCFTSFEFFFLSSFTLFYPLLYLKKVPLMVEYSCMLPITLQSLHYPMLCDSLISSFHKTRLLRKSGKVSENFSQDCFSKPYTIKVYLLQGFEVS